MIALRAILSRFRKSVSLSLGLGLAGAGLGTSLATVPLSLAGDGHLTVPAYVDGKGPFPFILDTGADESGIYQWLAGKLHLEKGKSEDLTGQTGTSVIPTFRIDRLSVDGRDLRNIAADGMPNRTDQGKEAGVAGNDLMDGLLAIFDFPCGNATLLPGESDIKPLLDGASVIQASLAKGTTLLSFPASLNGVEGVAILDTGSRDTRINSLFAKRAGIDPNGTGFVAGPPLNGASGHTLSSKQGPLGNITIQGKALGAVTGRVMDLPVFAAWGIDRQPSMILGMDVLRRHRLVYDHMGHRFWITRSSCALGDKKG